jgi:ABC-type amino acid transport substrate-binding protein
VAQAAGAAGGTLQRIQASGVVVIGHRESSVPMSYVANGTPMGYSVDVCLQIAQAIGRHLKLRETRVAYRMVTSGNRFDAIENGQVDLECGSTTNTAARRQRVAFTIAHFIASSRIVVQSGKPYSRIEDLDGKAVASTAGTTNIDSLAREAALKSVKVRVEPAKDHAEGFGWVVDGKVEGFAMDDVLLFGLRASHSKPEDLKVIGKPMTIEPYAVAFERNNPELKAVVDAELRRLIQTRELHRLYDKWFTSPIPPKGLNLNMRMPHLLVDSLKFPSDYVPQ